MAGNEVKITDNYFGSLKQAKNLTEYKLYKGVTDFGKVEQFNLYESGYAFLYVVDIPRFLKVLAKKNEQLALLINNYVHCIEHEFKNIDGFSEMQVEPIEINNGVETLNMIGKVNRQASTTITMTYSEKTGSVFTRFHEMFLRGIKDPSTQAKTYYGLIKSGEMEPGYENEIFTFLYINTDNTYLNIEKAYLFLAAQPTKAEVGIYEATKGEIGLKDVSIEYQVYMAEGKEINDRAKQILDYQNRKAAPESYEGIQLQSEAFVYTGTEKVQTDILKGVRVN